jgi:hypothetical protein
LAFEHQRGAHGTSIGPYDTGVQAPSQDEVRRAVKALVLGLALGVVLLLVARRASA